MSAAYALGARTLINALWAWPVHRPLNPQTVPEYANETGWPPADQSPVANRQ